MCKRGQLTEEAFCKKDWKLLHSTSGRFLILNDSGKGGVYSYSTALQIPVTNLKWHRIFKLSNLGAMKQNLSDGYKKGSYKEYEAP
jgi:hypothetical protein